MNTVKSTVASLVMLTACMSAMASEPYSEYLSEVYVTQQGDSLPYRLLTPEKADPAAKYPLVLFLHGSGERGNDNVSQLVHGGQMWLNPVNREKYPAYVVVPQCPEDVYWTFDGRPESIYPDDMAISPKPSRVARALVDLIGEMTRTYPVDASRIYVMGLSMGGMATYDLAIMYPQLFAAAVPICGSVNPARMEAAKDVKFRIYHGDADNVVPLDGSRKAYRALKAAGAEPVLIEFPGVGHGSWNPAFTDADLLPWLFSQSK